MNKISTNKIIFPTIWEKITNKANDFNNINWRFAGGFFIGKMQPLVDFYNLYRKEFKNIVSEKKVLPWEVNLWSYFEDVHDLKFEEYKADHDDRILQIPATYKKEIVTFVTALINPNEVRPEGKAVDRYFDNFKKLVETGISLHVFLSEDYLEKFNELYSENKNIFVETVKFEDLFSYKEVQGLEYELPKVRYELKDTKNYMLIINSKVEFLQKAITQNIFKNNQFAWIDFGINHMLQNSNVLMKLSTLQPRKGIYHASILPPNNQEDFDNVNWRFAASVVIGDKQSILDFSNLCMKEFKDTVKEKKILTWEVNYWQYLEYKFGLNLKTFNVRFNDSMILNI
jgi:hypothetical protein